MPEPRQSVPPLDDLPDHEVVGWVLAGDRRAYGILVARHQRRIHAAMWRLTGNAADAEELTQATFCRAYFALAGYRSEFAFGAWIHRIAHNLCVNHLRREHHDLGLDDLFEVVGDRPALEPRAGTEADPELNASRQDLAGRVRAALARLPEAFREVLILHFFQELSHEEMVARTGLPLGTIKSRLSRAKRQLARILSEQAAEPGTR